MAKNMMGMMKQAASMQREMKKLQKELGKVKYEALEGGGKIKAVARGDLSIDSVVIEEGAIEKFGPGRVSSMVTKVVNAALGKAKKASGKEMTRMTSGMGGLSDLLGG